MKRPCSYVKCQHRLSHYEKSDKSCNDKMIDVPSGYAEHLPLYCSMTCGLLDGWLVLHYETQKETLARQELWLESKNIMHVVPNK